MMHQKKAIIRGINIDSEEDMREYFKVLSIFLLNLYSPLHYDYYHRFGFIKNELDFRQRREWVHLSSRITWEYGKAGNTT